ncbi:MAG TPA: isoprenylcysteine carboxylmethyltransferase family protein, partial [Gammaproteobacteria bacterium]|nr:isoprenylcysteine carboxylmethyltransferase family protein [Gammaproteobacteria bacterium]
ARPGFKKAWTKLVPEPVERSTYVLFSSAALILLFAYWQPLGGTIWEVSNPTGVAVLYGLFGFGWALVLISTFLINHFDLFGLRQVWLYFRNTKYTDLPFGTPGPYKLIRHPLYLGWLFAFWCTPTMTVAHLLFAVVTTAYILVAIQFEEKDLKKFLGQAYVDYCKSVPMIIPFTKKKESSLDDSQTV